MTEVVQSEFFESVQDERYNVLSEHKIAIDGSSSSILISKKPAWNMGGSSNGVVNAVSGKQCQFRVFSSSDIRSYLPYFAILVKGHASKTVNGAEVSVNYNQVGIDWDACGTLIKNAYIRFNGNSALAETYQNSRYNVSHKLRMLTTLSRQMIEGDSSIFFTPCIESGRELKTGLTPECAARGRRWLSSETTANTAGGIVYHTRMFPLSHVFACCAIPGFSKLNIIDIVVEWSRTDQILFQTSTDTNQNNYIIDDVSIVVDQTKLSAPQASIELKEQRSGRDVQRSAYSYYEICQQSYVQNAKLIVPTCENLQGVIFTFPSTADNNGINSTQFILNDISSYSVMYDGQQVTDIPITIDTQNRMTNCELYYHYRKLIHKEYCTNYVPAIPAYEGFLAPLLTTSPRLYGENYGLMCTALWNSDAFHLHAKGAQVEIMTNQQSTGTSPTTAFICLVRMLGFQINPDSTTDVMN